MGRRALKYRHRSRGRSCIPAASRCCFSTLRCRCRRAPGVILILVIGGTFVLVLTPHLPECLCQREEGRMWPGEKGGTVISGSTLTYAMVIFKNKVCTFSMESVCPPVSVEAYVECSRETHREVLQK